MLFRAFNPLLYHPTFISFVFLLSFYVSACPVCYLPVEEAISYMPKAPSFSPVLQNLTFIHDESFTKSEFGGSDFGGYPTLKQRYDSYDVKESMSVHCGYDSFSLKIYELFYLFQFYHITNHFPLLHNKDL